MANIKITDLTKEINSVLESYGEEVAENVEEIATEVAKLGVKKLKEGGGYKERSGKYTKDWMYKNQSKKGKALKIIYNRKHYQLTHLLEFGHVVKGGTWRRMTIGNSKAFPHIGKVEEEITEAFQKGVMDKL